MKKYLFLTAFMAVSCVCIAQEKNQPSDIMVPSCSMDDWILLQKAPENGISSEDAADILQGRKGKVSYEADNGYYYRYSKERDKFGMLKLDASKGIYYRFLQKNSAGKREWVKSKNYYSLAYTAPNVRFWTFCIISFLLVFLFLLALINNFSYRNYVSEFKYQRVEYKWSTREARRKTLKVGLIASGIIGTAWYLIYLASLSAQLEPGNRIKFQILEPLVFVAGTTISFLLYLGLLSIIYWLNKQISKMRKSSLTVS